MENKELDPNLEMLQKIIERIKVEIDKKRTTDFNFTVKIKRGKIEEVEFETTFTINLD